MNNLESLLSLAKDVVQNSLNKLAESKNKLEDCSYDLNFSRELKAPIDAILESTLVEGLRITAISILSEESGVINGSISGDYCWVLDPLDGTVNFIRGIGPSGISVALCCRGMPIFGVIGIYPTMQLAWGGKNFGAFIDGAPIKVSPLNDVNKGIICGGFPSRFDYSEDSIGSYLTSIAEFGKVRMLGAASISLIQVASGCAEAYLENEIMIWDVAAGIAIVEGAGGVVKLSPGRFENSRNTFASNGNFQM